MNKTTGIVVAILVLAGAAYYFGVMREEGAMTDNGAAGADTQLSGSGEYHEVDPMMTGSWKSTEDPKFTREFKADGTMTDRYEGDESATETASFVTIDPAIIAVPGVPAANLSGMTVIRIDFASGPMFFSINSVTDTELAMTNLSGRGNLLSFVKVR